MGRSTLNWQGLARGEEQPKQCLQSEGADVLPRWGVGGLFSRPLQDWASFMRMVSMC